MKLYLHVVGYYFLQQPYQCIFKAIDNKKLQLLQFFIANMSANSQKEFNKGKMIFLILILKGQENKLLTQKIQKMALQPKEKEEKEKQINQKIVNKTLQIQMNSEVKINHKKQSKQINQYDIFLFLQFSNNYKLPILVAQNYLFFHFNIYLIQTHFQQMDIQFIELEHRENTLKLMELCGLEMNQAYQLYTNSGYNFQAAVNRHFNPPSRIQQPYIPPQNIHNQYQQQQMPFIHNQFGAPFLEDDQQNDPKYQEYKFFRHQGIPFNQKYPIQKHESFIKSLIPKFFKGEQQDKFLNDLDKYVGKRTNLKNTIGNLSQTLQWSWKQKYPVLLINMDFSPQFKANSTIIFTDRNVIELTFAQQFKIYGFNPTQYVMQNELIPIFQPEANANSFMICRINCIDQIQIIGKIGLNQPLQQIKKHIKLYKSECIQRQLQQSHIVRQYEQQRRGNIYQRPRTIKQTKKLKQDKKLRKLQQQQFFKSYQNKKQQPQQSNKTQKKEQNYKPEIKKQVKKQQKKVQIPKISEEEMRLKRQQQFNLLNKYNSGLVFKIRVPSGKNFIVNVDPNEKVAYLFDYIALLPEDIGFNNQIQRRFDIFMGFGGKQTLKGKQNVQIKSLFEDSEVLIIRQILD